MCLGIVKAWWCGRRLRPLIPAGKIGTTAYFHQKLKARYGDEKAAKIAVQVSNYIFLEKPGLGLDPEDFYRDFIKNYLEESLSETESDPFMQDAIAQSLSAKAIVDAANGKLDKELLRGRAMMLETYGIKALAKSIPDSKTYANLIAKILKDYYPEKPASSGSGDNPNGAIGSRLGTVPNLKRRSSKGTENK
jgi:hypothetical protein